MPASTRCPCGSGDTYLDCCARYHSSQVDAPTAESLMRSRFSAFARGEAAYLLRTWDPSTRPPRIDLDDRVRWTHLEIVGTAGGGLFERAATVEFRAHYRTGSVRGVQPERSRFARIGGRWFYVGADVLT